MKRMALKRMILNLNLITWGIIGLAIFGLIHQLITDPWDLLSRMIMIGLLIGLLMIIFKYSNTKFSGNPSHYEQPYRNAGPHALKNSSPKTRSWLAAQRAAQENQKRAKRRKTKLRLVPGKKGNSK